MARGRWIAALVVMTGMAWGEAEAQTWQTEDEGWCERWGGRDQERHCFVLSSSIADPGELVVDGGMNGGIDVVGYGGSQVEIRAKVWGNARSMERAREIADAVEVEARGGRLSVDGPDTNRRESWGVSWELRVPFDTDLDLEAFNGGISIVDVGGTLRFETMNGGVTLEGVSGDVEGSTTNGGLDIVLEGDRWDGRGLDVETVNGGVNLTVPEGYSARLETGTVNGGIDVSFPVTVQGRIGRRLNVELGEGGPTIRVRTTNGGVDIDRGGYPAR